MYWFNVKRTRNCLPHPVNQTSMGIIGRSSLLFVFESINYYFNCLLCLMPCWEWSKNCCIASPADESDWWCMRIMQNQQTVARWQCRYGDRVRMQKVNFYRLQHGRNFPLIHISRNSQSRGISHDVWKLWLEKYGLWFSRNWQRGLSEAND